MNIVKQEREVIKQKVGELYIGVEFLNIENNQLCMVIERNKNLVRALELQTGEVITYLDLNDLVGKVRITDIKYKEL